MKISFEMTLKEVYFALRVVLHAMSAMNGLIVSMNCEHPAGRYTLLLMLYCFPGCRSARAGTQVVLSDDDEMSTAKTYDRVEQSTAVVANPKRGAGAKAGTPKAKAVTRTKSSPARKKDMSAGQCAPKVGKSTKVMKTKKPKKKKKGDSDEDGSDTDEDGDSEVGEDDEAFALDWFDKLALKDDTGERKTFRVPTVYLE